MPGGSSCGTGAALAANYAPLGLGTDASGSVLMPAADSGVLGLIPSRGLVSRAGSMCMAPTIGRLGIMARSAFDLAALLSCLAGWDPEDMTTAEALERFPRQPYESQLAGASLGAFRIGVLREMWRDEPRHGEGIAIMDRLLATLRQEGAILVDPVLTGIDLQGVGTLETWQSSATSYELIPAMNAYFAGSVPTRRTGTSGRSSTRQGSMHSRGDSARPWSCRRRSGATTTWRGGRRRRCSGTPWET